MKNGRINERNTGSIKLDGGTKRIKSIPTIKLSDIEEDAYNSLKLCNMVLDKGIKLYDKIPELIQQWLKNGIVEIKEFENTCEVAKKYYPIEKRAILIESKRSDIELCKRLLIEFYPKILL